jgi:hypothetical protein
VHDRPERSDFSRQALTDRGYGGWVPLRELRPGGTATVEGVPGTYVVVRPSDDAPVFLAVSPAGCFKGRDPSVPVDQLRANWVDGATTLYIGKADNLTDRVRSMAAFGDGRPQAHYGGRLVWQLADAAAFLFAWRPLRLGFTTARGDEVDMIERFRSAYGKPPFANDPQRHGR